MTPDSQNKLEGERTREPALRTRPANWHEPRRRPVHHVIPSSDRATVIYLTICTKNRVPWMANDAVHALLRDVWSNATAWQVGRYVIMPDHTHLFAGWAGGPILLETWIRYWKRQFTMRHGNLAHRWQSGYWDTTIITMDQCEEKWMYVRDNPVRHNLVEDASHWPYAGVIHDFIWP